MREDNVVQSKSYAFALRIIRLFQHLCNGDCDITLARQVLKCGTSIGANVEEAIGGQSTNDFHAKMAISYKECRETHYWLRLFRDANLLDTSSSQSILADCDELLKIIGSIQKTMKTKRNIQK